MAFTPGYQYDIFISFSPHDHTSSPGKPDGWAEQFYKNLNMMLAKHTGRLDIVKVWCATDTSENSSQGDQSADNAIQRSAIMICLDSSGYAASDQCKQELEAFYKKAQAEKAGLKVGGCSRIFHVLLNNIPIDKWPKEVIDAGSFQFFQSTEAVDPGQTIDTTSTEFKTEMQKLVDAVWKQLNDFLNERSAGMGQTQDKTGVNKEALAIFLGDVSDQLLVIRKRIMSELTSKGFHVLTADALSTGSDGTELATKEALDHSDISIHLLDGYPGREITGDPGTWNPQKQTEIALRSGKPQMIWVPAETDIEKIDDLKYKQFLQSVEKGLASEKEYEFVRGNKSTLTHDIIVFAEQVGERQKQKNAGNGMVSVMLDTHYCDQIYAIDLARVLLENKIQPFINPQEDDPGKNIHLMGERLSQVNKLIFLYGSVSKEWVRERMNTALELIITNNYPIKDLIVYMAPPVKDTNNIFINQQFLKVTVINKSKNTVMSKEELKDFLNLLNSSKE